MEQPLGLVADIGRQSVRFGLAGGRGGSGPREVVNFAIGDHRTFTDALVHYLSRVGHANAALPSVLAVAGMVRGDVINLTGSRWFVSLSGIEAVLRHRPVALNECAATALALTTLAPRDVLALPGAAPATVRPGGSYLVVSPGTGLGVAALVTAGDRLIPIQSEAAHMAFAARTAQEEALAAALTRSAGTRATNEMVLSAGGLAAAYAVAAGRPVADVRPEDVTRAAAHDRHAQAALALFTGALAAVVGDLALAFGAWDGVFLTGAIPGAIVSRLADPGFRARIGDRRAFRRQLGELPLAIVPRQGLELAGAATLLGRA